MTAPPPPAIFSERRCVLAKKEAMRRGLSEQRRAPDPSGGPSGGSGGMGGSSGGSGGLAAPSGRIRRRLYPAVMAAP